MGLRVPWRLCEQQKAQKQGAQRPHAGSMSLHKQDLNGMIRADPAWLCSLSASTWCQSWRMAAA